MTMKDRIQTGFKAVAVFAVAVGLVATSLSSSAFAQSAANTLKVTPVRTDVQVNPGETKIVETTVSNLTGAPITVRPSANDFVAGDESGTPSLILDENQYAPSHSLKRFMQPLADITIPANSAVTVNVTITVPADATAGGYFGAVRFSPTAPDGGGQVNLSASVASIILMTVPGDVVEKLQMTDFNVQQNGRTNSIFFNDNAFELTTRFTSQSSVQLGPTGKISVKKGDKVVYETDFNNQQPQDVILPDSARRWNIPLDKIEGFGHYSVVATFSYGQSNQNIEATTSFWVIPWYVIAIAGAILLVIIAAVVVALLIIRNKRRRNARPSSSQSGLRL